jgi:hypothetical protein
MIRVVRKKKKTLFGRVVRKIESELSSRENRAVPPNISLGDTCVNDADAAAIQARREEMKAVMYENKEDIIYVNHS